MPGSFSRMLGIWLAESPDLVHWGQHRPVALPRPGMWDEARIGASLTPFRVDGGWLEVYHGADRTNRYGMGAMLLDADDPAKVLARSAHPLLGARARVRAIGVPARRGLPERARDARRRTHPRLLRRRRLDAWPRPTSRSRTSSPTSNRAETARATHPPAARRAAPTRSRVAVYADADGRARRGQRIRVRGRRVHRRRRTAARRAV